MDNPNKKSAEEQQLLDKLQKDYDLMVERSKQKMIVSHTAKEYTFSLSEKRRLLQQQTIQVLIQNAIDDILNMSVLPRVGVTPGPEIRVLYDITVGRFTVFIPKPIQETSSGDSVDSSAVTTSEA